MVVYKPYGTEGIYFYGETSRLYGTGFGMPFNYKILIEDNNGNALEYIDDIVRDCSWSFKRYGGCAAGQITVVKQYPKWNLIQPNYRVKIYINKESTISFSHVYTGYISGKSPVYGDSGTYTINLLGFSAQMARIYIGTKMALQYPGPSVGHDTDVIGFVISDMVKDIVNNLICPRTNIIYDAAYIDATTVPLLAPVSLQDRSDACIDRLAMLTGVNHEWGVDKDLKFYFRAESDTDQSWWWGDRMESYTEHEEFEQIKNRIFVKDGEFTDTYEYEPDLVLVQSATGITDALALGKATDYQQVVQNFTTTDKTISRIIIKARTAGGSDGNLVTDGDMETDAVTNWPADGATPTITADTTTYSHGVKSLKIETDVPYTGAHQSVASPADGLYRLAFDYYVSLGSLIAIIDDAAGTELARSDIFLETDSGSKSYRRAYVDFSTAGSLASIDIRFLSTEQHKALSGFKGIAYVDNVTLTYNASLIKGYLYDSTLHRKVGKECVVAIDGTSYAEYTFDVQHYGAVSGRSYTFWLETMSGLSDDYYFELAYDDPNTISGGALKYYDGADWNTVATHNLYFKTYKNSSQEKFGLMEEQVSPVTKNAADMQAWCNGYLAGRTQTFKSIEVGLQAVRWILDDGVPAAGIGKFAPRLGGGNPYPGQTTKNDATIISARKSATLYYACQSFQHSADFELTSCTLRLTKVSTPTGLIWVEIREDNYGKPAASVVANGTSATVDVSTLGAAADKEFTWASGPTLSAYRTYWIVVSGDWTVDGAKYVDVVKNAATNLYADGQAKTMTSAYVAAVSDYDVYFILAGNELINGYDIDTIQYAMSESGLNVQIQAGQELPDAAKKLRQLEHNLTGYQQFLT